jgi:FKBP-type peptidyl-prolyl cis-trans isomerase (trigger factor)
MMYRGADAAQIEEHIAELRAATAAVARRELMLFFVLDKAARDMNVGVTEAEVNARVAQLAQSRGERPENLRSQLIQSGQINGVAQQIREHKTLDQIIAKAKISEAPLEEFNRQMAARKAGAGAGAGAGAPPAPAKVGGSKKKGG